MLGPNITGNIGSPNTKNNLFTTNGAFAQSSVATWTVSGDANLSFYPTTFDASRSSRIYGGSSTVQPPALVFNYIIKC